MVSIYGIPNLSLDKAPLEIREVGSRSLGFLQLSSIAKLSLTPNVER